MATKLIGMAEPVAGVWSGSYWLFEKYTVATAGTCNELWAYTKGTGGGIKGAVYSDVGGEPTALLGYSTSIVAETNGWTILPLETAVVMAVGETYWLCIVSMVGGNVCNSGYATYTQRIVRNNYALDFPSPCWTSWDEHGIVDNVITNPAIFAGYANPFDPSSSHSWTIPTCNISLSLPYASHGTAVLDYGHSLLSIKENVVANSTSTLDIVFNNSDKFFDSVGVGQLSTLTVGSRVNLFLGYLINTNPVDGESKEYVETNRYFIDSWSYTRVPNSAEFILHCIDAWGLLEKYRFNRKVSFNYSGATTTYSVYDLIEMLCQAIGGSLSYISRSSFIITFKPLIEVNAGENAANLLRRLLNVTPDEIRFFGNVGYIINPETVEKNAYLFKFPIS